MRKYLFIPFLLLGLYLLIVLLRMPYGQFSAYTWGQFTGTVILLVLSSLLALFLYRRFRSSEP